MYKGRKITLIPPFHSRNTEAIVRDPITEREAVALMGAHTIGKVGGFRFINDVITTETVSIRCSPYYHTPITETKKQPFQQ